MMTLFRRFVVLQALLLWQGGFLFYTSVVVPIGTDQLGSASEQGQITRRVTDVMNAIGCFALALVLWDLLRDRAVAGFRCRLGLWFFMALLLVGLIVLHPEMDQILDSDNYREQKATFRLYHRVYLWLSTFQWLAGVFYVGLMIRTWDQSRATSRD